MTGVNNQMKALKSVIFIFQKKEKIVTVLSAVKQVECTLMLLFVDIFLFHQQWDKFC